MLEEQDKEQNMLHERPSLYLFVKTFQKEDGSKYVHFESVTVSQDGMEVSVSSHIIRENQLKNKVKNDRLLYKATALDAPAITSAEQPIEGGSLSSTAKIANNSLPNQENVVKNTAKLPKKPLKGVKMKDYAANGKNGMTNFEKLNAVFHEDGFEVASDGRILLARKSDYPKELEGKVTDPESGLDVTEAHKLHSLNGRAYPDWKKVIPTEETLDGSVLSVEELKIIYQKAIKNIEKRFKEGEFARRYNSLAKAKREIPVRVNQLLDKAANGSTFQEIAQAHIELNKLEKFSISNEQQVHNGEVSRAYDEAVASNSFRLAESWLDYMASLKKLQQAIEKKFGVKLKDYEDAYTAENQLSSPKIC